MSLRYVDPMKETPEGKLLAIVKQLEEVAKAKYANMNCSVCNSVCNSEGECPTCGDTKKGEKDKDFAALAPPYDKATLADRIAGANKKGKKDKGYKSDRGEKKPPELPSPEGKKIFGKADMGEKNKYCRKHFGCDYSECTDKQKAQCNRECGKVEKGDATTAFLRERGIIVKYEQEKTVENGVPQLLEQPSGTRATVYSTNHRIPAMNDGPSKSIVSEVAKMPSVAQTGYDTNASSLHMHLNYAGGVTDNLDSAEDALASLRKAYPGSLGIIEEIASLTEQVYARL